MKRISIGVAIVTAGLGYVIGSLQARAPDSGPVVATVPTITAPAEIPTAPPAGYLLADTEIVATPAPALGRDYEAYVSLPKDYHNSDRRYPVLYLTDANYAFPLVRSIADRISKHGVGLQDFILVGLSYAKGESGVQSRNRDYTPTPRRSTANTDATIEYGQADAYARFLVEQVIPSLEARYRIDPTKRIYAGHSYGALLGLHFLFKQPDLFSHYILGSPSLWYDREHLFGSETRYAATTRSLPAKVRFYIGEYEAQRLGHPRFSQDGDMVADLERFVTQMQSRHYAGLDLRSQVFADEDHATVFPTLISRGLMWALPLSSSEH